MRTILPSASLTLNELVQVANAFEGHRGRPGQRGGSLPRSHGTGSSPSSSGSRSYSYRPSYEDRPERQERVVDHEEINRRIAHGLQSDDPEIRLRAKAAKARYEMYQARQQVYDAVPPALTQAQTRKLEQEATNPLHRVPEMKEGETFTDHALRSFIYAMESLDKPGRIVRGALGGKVREVGNIIPFSDYLGITKADQAVSGRDLLQKIGIVGPNTDGFDAGDVAGFIVDAFTDPLMYVGGIGAISRSAKVVKVTRKTLNPKTAAKIATDAEKLRRSTYLSLKRKGNTEATAKRLATIKSKKFLEEGLDAAVDRANVRARAAKPVKFGTTESVKTKGKKVSAEAAAAAKKAAVSTGRIGGTPAAAVMMLLDAVGKLPIAGELIRRVRKRIESKMGKVTARVREKTVNPTVKILGKEFKTGVKKPTTVGALVGKANKTTVGHPKFKKTKLQLQELAKYANQAHTAGKTFLEATGVADQIKRDKEAKKTTNNLETLVANYAGGVRKEKWQGRDYFVAPLSLIVEGVLNGSKGPLHYPMAEMKQNFSAWNGTPIVVYHPTDSHGNALRAKGNPEVLNKSIGVVRNACIKHPKLVAEGWFDAEKTKEVDPRVYNALSKGQPMELSTGLHTDNEPANNGAHWNGRSYTHVARNYRPDHLAILPDQQGACSLNDGCGVLVNSRGKKNMTVNGLLGGGLVGLVTGQPVESTPSLKKRALAAAAPKVPRMPKPSTKLPKAPKPKKPMVVNEDEDEMEEYDATVNEWSDEARAASLAARRAKMYAREGNVKHTPEHHAKMAASYHRKAFQARRGGSFKKPDEVVASHFDELAKMHEQKEADPAYHRKEAFYHKQDELEKQDFAKKAPGHYIKKATSAAFRGGVGGVAGSIGGSLVGSLAGKYAGRAIGSVLGSTTIGTLGGIAGATLGGLGAGPVGAAVGGVAGSTLGKASGRIIGSFAGAPVGKVAAAAAGSIGAALGRVGSPGAAAVAREVGGKLGGTAGSVVGSITGGVAGTALGASSGYRKAKKKIHDRYQQQVLEARSRSDYHQLALEGLSSREYKPTHNQSEEIVENKETEVADILVETACVTNEWSDAARLAAAEARKRQFSRESNVNHIPGHHTSLAAMYRKKAADARKGGLFRKPSEDTAMHHEELAKLHEDREKDPNYHKAELDYHKKQEVERKGYGSYVGRMLGHGAVGSLAGGLIGGAIGGLATGGAGAPVGAVLGSEIGGIAGAHHGFVKASDNIRDSAAKSASYHQGVLRVRPKVRKPRVGATNLV